VSSKFHDVARTDRGTSQVVYIRLTNFKYTTHKLQHKTKATHKKTILTQT